MKAAVTKSRNRILGSPLTAS